MLSKQQKILLCSAAIIALPVFSFSMKHNSESLPKSDANQEMVLELNEETPHENEDSTLRIVNVEPISDCYNYREPRVPDFDPIKYVNLVYDQWSNGLVDSDSAQERILIFTTDSNIEVSKLANNTKRKIIIEDRGRKAIELADGYLNDKKYPEAMDILSKVSSEFSLSSLAQEKYNNAKVLYINSFGSPKTVDEYRNAIGELKTTCNKVKDKDLEAYKYSLAKRLNDYLPIHNVLIASTDYYSKGDYKSAFTTLEKGVRKFKGNKKLKEALASLQYAYIIEVSENILELCESKQYDTAESNLKEAMGIYPNNHFNDLMHELKMQSDFLYAAKYNAEEVGNYVLKSGRKMVLGDFDEENQQTILSATGRIGASLVNIDAPLDVIDLAYDVSHWGEGDYFAARLVLDAVGIIPIIGALKYLKHLDEIHDAAKFANNLDTITDGAKIISKTEAIVDTTSDIIDTVDLVKDITNKAEIVIDISKTTDNIDSVADTIKDTTNLVDNAHDITKNYKYIQTKNYTLLNKTHPETGVKFVMDKIDLADDTHIEGVFPVFDSLQDVELPKDLWKKSFDEQKDFLAEYMQKLASDPNGRKQLSKSFDEDAIQDFMDGIIPDDYIWHHNQQEGLMQLVDAETHIKTGHTGGMSIWGKGY